MAGFENGEVVGRGMKDQAPILLPVRFKFQSPNRFITMQPPTNKNQNKNKRRQNGPVAGESKSFILSYVVRAKLQSCKAASFGWMWPFPNFRPLFVASILCKAKCQIDAVSLTIFAGGS